MFKEYFKKWKKKSPFSKIIDFFFLALLLTLLFPQGRMAVGGFVNRAKSMVSQPGLIEERVPVAESSFNWEMTTVDNSSFDLKNSKGKVIFLNLWATWCPPCVGEMPGIQDLYDKFKDNPKVEFVLVSNEAIGTINKFIERKEYTFPVFSSQVQTPPAFATRSIPTTYVISKKGEIVVKEIGAVNWGGKKMEGIIDQLLNEE